MVRGRQMDNLRLTTAQLDALVALVGMHSGPAFGAGLVLIEGYRPADAARAAGMSPQALGNALARLRRAMVLAQTVVGH